MSSSSQRSSILLMTSASAAAFTQPLQSHMKGKGTSENGPYTMCIACVSYVVDSVRS